MGATAAVVGIGLLAGATASKLMAPKSPNAPPAAPMLDPAGNEKKAQGASDQQRKRLMGASGRGDTILTGPKGLGEIGAQNTETKTLLGY